MDARRHLVLGALATSLCACGPPAKGALDERTGLQGVVVSDGSLAGAWAVVAEFPTIAHAGVLGEQPAGFRSTWLVDRQWDASGARYLETYRRCTRDLVEVSNTRLFLPAKVYPRLRTFAGVGRVEHGTGHFFTGTVVELWGVDGLADAVHDALPGPDDYQQPGPASLLLDEDQDGAPAITQYAQGMVSGKLYSLERVVFSLDGVVVAPSRVQGLGTLEGNTVRRLWATTSLLVGADEPRVDPARSTWFDAVRLGPTATCDDVLAAVADGRVSSTRPF